MGSPSFLIFRAVADQKGYSPADIDGLILSPDLPKFGHLEHMDALAKFLQPVLH